MSIHGIYATYLAHLSYFFCDSIFFSVFNLQGGCSISCVCCDASLARFWGRSGQPLWYSTTCSHALELCFNLQVNRVLPLLIKEYVEYQASSVTSQLLSCVVKLWQSLATSGMALSLHIQNYWHVQEWQDQDKNLEEFRESMWELTYSLLYQFFHCNHTCSFVTMHCSILMLFDVRSFSNEIDIHHCT
jgi:hypothetical protein